MSSTLVANTLLSSFTGENIDLHFVASGNGSIVANSSQIKDVADPTENQDAATKKYVDDEVAANVPGLTTIDYAGSITVDDSGQTVTDTLGAEWDNQNAPGGLELSNIQNILSNNRGYDATTEAPASAQLIYNSFGNVRVSRDDWISRYANQYSIDQNTALVYKSNAAQSIDPILFYLITNNAVGSYSPVTNEIGPETGLNYKLKLPPGAKSYFPDGTLFFRKNSLDPLITVAPKDLGVGGYVAQTKVDTNDTTFVDIVTIPVIANLEQLVEFKVMSHLTNDSTLRWSIDFILKYDAGTISTSNVSIQDNFGTSQPIILQYVESGGEITVRARARETGNTDYANSVFMTKVDIISSIFGDP